MLNTPTIKDLKITKSMTSEEILSQMRSIGGFMGKNLAVAKQVLEDMFADQESKNFLSFPSCLIATGLRGVLTELIKKNYFHCVITSCGTWGQDIVREYADYHEGTFDTNDTELHQKNIIRLGNLFMNEKDHGPLIEDKFVPMLNEIYQEKKEISTYELSWEIGKRLPETSFLHQCYLKKIPVIVPGYTDGAIGNHLWMFSRTHPDFKINAFKDETLLNDLVSDAKKTGALILGGGTPKHHTIWWNQFKNGLDYSIYMTTSPEWDGSLSGARTKEGITWGKINERAKHITVPGDVTISFPFLAAKFL